MIKVYNKDVHTPANFRKGTVLRLKGTQTYVAIAVSGNGKKTLKFTKKPSKMKGGANVSIPKESFLERLNPFASYALKCGKVVHIDVTQVRVPGKVKIINVEGVRIPETLAYKHIVPSIKPTAACNSNVFDITLMYNNKRQLADTVNRDRSYTFVYNNEMNDITFALWVYFISNKEALRNAKKAAAFSKYLCENEELCPLISQYKLLSNQLAIQNMSNGRLSDLARLLEGKSLTPKTFMSIVEDVYYINKTLAENKFYVLDPTIDDYDYSCISDDEYIDIKLAVLDSIYSPKAQKRTGNRLSPLDRVNKSTVDALEVDVCISTLKIAKRFKYLSEYPNEDQDYSSYQIKDNGNAFLKALNEFFNGNKQVTGFKSIDDLFQ